MQHEHTRVEIHEGMEVFGSDDEKLGEVKEARGSYFVVEEGFIFTSDHFVPASAIDSVDADSIRLSVTKETALEQGWENEPTDDEITVVDEDADLPQAQRSEEGQRRTAGETAVGGEPGGGPLGARPFNDEAARARQNATRRPREGG